MVTLEFTHSCGGTCFYTVAFHPSGARWGECTSGDACEITGLTNGEAVSFTVTARNEKGVTGPASAPSAAVTPFTAPVAFLTILSVVAGDRQETITFEEIGINTGDDGYSPITAYRVKIPQDGGLTLGSCPGSPCTVTGLTNGEPYSIYVVAVNAAGEGAWDGLAWEVTPVGAPGAPTNVQATAVAGNVALTFTRPRAGADISPILYYAIAFHPSSTEWEPCCRLWRWRRPMLRPALHRRQRRHWRALPLHRHRHQ